VTIGFLIGVVFRAQRSLSILALGVMALYFAVRLHKTWSSALKLKVASLMLVLLVVADLRHWYKNRGAVQDLHFAN
jgi:hypothetical protein